MSTSNDWKDVLVAGNNFKWRTKTTGNFDMRGSLYTLAEVGEDPVIEKLYSSVVVTASSIAQGEVRDFIDPKNKSVW